MTNLKTVQIKHGNKTKEYVEVNERIRYFRENYKDFRLTTEIIELSDAHVLMRASVISPEGHTVATGHAHELKNDGYINKTSHIENCETSAWGRALGCFGIGIQTSVASYDEVKMAIDRETRPATKTPAKPPKTVLKNKLASSDEVRWQKGVEYAFKNGVKKLFELYEIPNGDKIKMTEAVLDRGLLYAKENGVDALEELNSFTDGQIKVIIEKIYG